MMTGRLKLMDTSDMKVTIGLCFKNAEKTIRECVKRILDQDYPHELMEIIMVDGKSTDNTLGIAENMISKSNISSRLHSDDGKGLGRARQIVLEKADSKYVVWIDSDVLVSRDFVRSQIKFMEENPQVGVATGMYSFRQDAHVSLPALLQSLAKLVGSIEFKETSARGLPPNDASVYRVQAARRVGGFDTHIRGAAEDEDIILRMRKVGWLISVNRDAKFFAYTRQTWHDVWAEAAWFGYGKHYLGHKYQGLHVCMYRIPLINFYVGIKVSLKAYRLTAQPKSFLLPLAYVFSTIAWWFGFMKANFEGYGHEQS